MSKNTSISLGDHFENFIADNIGSGRYQSAIPNLRTREDHVKIKTRILKLNKPKLNLAKEVRL